MKHHAQKSLYILVAAMLLMSLFLPCLSFEAEADGAILTMLGGQINPSSVSLRFGAEYDASYLPSGATVTSLGVLAYPTSRLNTALTVDSDGAPAPGVVRAKATSIINYQAGYSFPDYSTVDFYMNILSIPENGIETYISARAYVIYTLANGTSVTEYSETVSRSYKQVYDSVYSSLAVTSGDNVLVAPEEWWKDGLPAAKVAYIPIDDRPVNVERVVYLAESAEIELLMPGSDLYATHLDSQTLNSNGTQYGDGEALMDWLEQTDLECDCFVISLDMLLSGGLVNSRVGTGSTDYTAEYALIDRLAALTKHNTVYVFDTVMRLASTVGYSGYTLNEYNLLRSYGAQSRPVLSGTSLTVSGITANYRYNQSGGTISSTLSSSTLTQYLNARTRKLTIADYALDTLPSGTLCFIGVDDSSPDNTIQSNEINYLSAKLGTGGTIFGGTDELGMLTFTKFMCDNQSLYPTASTVYFGGSENEAGDGFDIGTLSENLISHIEGLGMTVLSSNADIEVLVLTSPSDTSLANTYVNNWISRINSNIASGIPTIAIKAMTSAYGSYYASALTGQTEMSMLLGYSGWNTTGNAIGIALSQGISRYVYLSSASQVTQASNIGFVKSLTFGFIKDIAYRDLCYNAVCSYASTLGSTSNFYSANYDAAAASAGIHSALNSSSVSVNEATIISSLEGSRFITGIDGSITTGRIMYISVDNYAFPWYRTFEASFDVAVTLY